MIADYNFYKDTYKGIVFADATSYEFFGERASDELALYSNMKVFTENETANTQLKKCACRIADILHSGTNNEKQGKNIASESVNGYYSVSYVNVTNEQIRQQINACIVLYIGRYVLGSKKVMW